MKTVTLKSRFSMPALGIGTFSFGGEHEPDHSRDEEWINTIRTAIKMGYTHIDTAEVYGGNHTEELVGEAIRGFDTNELLITSKVYNTHFRYDDLIAAAKASLKRMGIKHLDLYLLHSSNPDVPIQETMEAMNALVNHKLVRNIGVCNFSIEELKEAQKCSAAKIVANQMKLSLWTKAPADVATMNYCQEHDIMVIAYKLFGRGKLLTDRVPLLIELASKYRKSQAQILINWATAKKNFSIIFTSMNKQHLEENQAGLDFEMLAVDHARIDKLYRWKKC
ncbi:MAG: aldo/keto reductase [Candidatus Woesearchaeota archaeon]